MLRRTSTLVRGLLLAAEDHQYPALRTELDHHIRPLVGDPYVVFLIDFDGMSKAPGVQIVADLTDVVSSGVKLKQLSRRRAIGWAGSAATRENENMSL